VLPCLWNLVAFDYGGRENNQRCGFLGNRSSSIHPLLQDDLIFALSRAQKMKRVHGYVMTHQPSPLAKLLSPRSPLTAIAEKCSITHVDTVSQGVGAVLFLMLMDAQQRAGVNEPWGHAGRGTKITW
jgi:hypothetical protein